VVTTDSFQFAAYTDVHLHPPRVLLRCHADEGSCGADAGGEGVGAWDVGYAVDGRGG
jgi:hypothetical protein